MKKVSVLLLAVVLLLFVGCSAAKSPDTVLAMFFAAVKEQDSETVQALSISEVTTAASASPSADDTSPASPSSSSDLESAEVMNLAFSKMTVTIEDKVTVSGDSASAPVKITAPDTKVILQACIAAAMKDAFSNALSGSASENDTQNDFTKQFVDALSKPDVALTTTEMTVQLKKVDGSWMVVVTDELMDAMTGGMIGYAKNLANAFQQ
ncbi:hypothetical protein IZU99_02665 [Oscillospiraceae bacterium CM]|nr:hypothetical protein IZU99_02665 [Oscillospiraceae bacterium CM]